MSTILEWLESQHKNHLSKFQQLWWNCQARHTDLSACITWGWCFDIYLRYSTTNNRAIMIFFVDVLFLYDTGTWPCCVSICGYMFSNCLITGTVFTKQFSWGRANFWGLTLRNWTLCPVSMTHWKSVALAFLSLGNRRTLLWRKGCFLYLLYGEGWLTWSKSLLFVWWGAIKVVPMQECPLIPMLLRKVPQGLAKRCIALSFKTLRRSK